VPEPDPEWEQPPEPPESLWDTMPRWYRKIPWIIAVVCLAMFVLLLVRDHDLQVGLIGAAVVNALVAWSMPVQERMYRNLNR
jgi:hypothetical protein